MTEATPEKKPPPARVVNATYVGRRITTDNKLAHFWHVEGEAKPAGYMKQVAPAAVGEIWRLSFNDKDNIYVGGDYKPQNTEMFCDPDTRARYVGEDAAAYQRHVDMKADRALKNRETEFERAMEPLRRLIRAVRSYDDRHALIRRITSELGKTPTK